MRVHSYNFVPLLVKEYSDRVNCGMRDCIKMDLHNAHLYDPCAEVFMSRDHQRTILKFHLMRSICFALMISAIGSTSITYVQSVKAESAAASKLAKIEKLYEVSGARERINTALEVGALKQSMELQGEIFKKLKQSKVPEAQAKQLSDSKSELFKSKMKEKIASLVKESFMTYSVYTDSNLTEPDIDFLLQYYTSDSVKAFNAKAATLSSNITRPVIDEIKVYLKNAQEDMTAGKEPRKFPVPDQSKEIAAIDPEKLTTIKSILHSSSVVDNLANFFKTTFDSLAEGASSDEDMKMRQKVLNGIPYKTIMRPLIVIAYDKNFTEEELQGIDNYLTDSKMEAAKPHMIKAEQSIMEALGPKYDVVAQATSKEVLADLNKAPAPAKAPVKPQAQAVKKK